MYPNELYITATGSADTQDDANKRAINGVAQVIKVDLKSQQELVAKYFETGVGQDMLIEATSQFTVQIELRTEQSLKNINIGKTWLSKEDGRYYAFAYMDRAETGAIYSKNIAEIDVEINDYYDRSKKANDKLTKLAYLYKSINLAAQRDALNEQMTTITQGQQSIPPSVAPADLIEARLELTQQCKVKLDLDYSKWNDFPNAVTDVLTSYGFHLTDANPDFIVSGKLSMEKLKREGFFIRWAIELHFTDLSTNTEFLNYSDEDREGHKSFEEAERRAIVRLSAAIRKNLFKRIDAHLSSLTGG
jgi:hypothetical protein